MRGIAFLRGLSELCNVDGKLLPINVTGGDSEEPLYIFALRGFGLRQCMHFEMKSRAECEVWAEA